MQQQVNYTLDLQCHSEGVFWRGLVPLLLFTEESSESNAAAAAADLALAALMAHYQSCITIRSSSSIKCHRDEVEASSFELTSHILRNNHIAVLEDDHCLTIQIINTSSLQSLIASNYRTNDTNANNKHIIPPVIILTIHPPDPSNNYYSRTPSTRPTNTYTLQLLQYEKHQIQLTSLSAYLSTLGGGYFLTHQTSTAYNMAYRQYIVANRRGDMDMGWRCRINMGYCCFYTGGCLEYGKKIVWNVLNEVMCILRRDDESDIEHGDVCNNNKNNNNIIHDDENILQNSSTNGSPSNLAYSSPLHKITNNNNEKKYNQTMNNHETTANYCNNNNNLIIIKNMCLSALWFAEKLQEANTSKTERHGNNFEGLGGSSSTSGGISSTHDDYKRIRVVRDRSKKVVR
eukprot:scaffold107436_cov39-Cyclotella_meneghiniana.AAC.3